MFQRQVSFSEAINIALRQKYATFTGRASRSEYWFFVLFTFILGAACYFLSGILGAIGNTGMELIGVVITFVVWLGLLLPGWAVTVRRLHDIGKSGWWLLGYILVSTACAIVLYVSLIVSIFTLIRDDVPYSVTNFIETVQPTIGLIAVAAIVQLAVYIIAIVWMCKPSQPHPNQYGPVPNLVSE